MFAHSSLRENSVINYDMIFKYVLSGYTWSQYSNNAYEPYSSSFESFIENNHNNDNIKQSANRFTTDIMYDFGFVFHPGGSAGMDSIYRDDRAAIRVQDSVALNPKIVYSGWTSSGLITGANISSIGGSSTYDLTFSNDKVVRAIIGFDIYDIESEFNLSDLTEGDMNITYRDTDNGEELDLNDLNSFGELIYVKFIDKDIHTSDTGYEIAPVGTKHGGIKLLRGGKIGWKQRTLTQDEDLNLLSYVTPTDVVWSNFCGGSKSNIGVVVIDDQNYKMTFTGTPLTTWLCEVRGSSSTLLNTASTWTASLFVNGSTTANKTQSLSWTSDSFVSASTIINYTTKDNFSVQWTGNNSYYEVERVQNYVNGSTLISRVWLTKKNTSSTEYDFVVFPYTESSEQHNYYIGVDIVRTNNVVDSVNLSSTFTSSYGTPSRVMKIRNGDTIRVRTGEDDIDFDWNTMYFHSGTYSSAYDFFEYEELGSMIHNESNQETDIVFSTTDFHDTGACGFRIQVVYN